MRRRLAASGPAAEDRQHLVLTGGGSQLTGLPDLAANMFGRPARLGRPRAMSRITGSGRRAGLRGGDPNSCCIGRAATTGSRAARGGFLRTGTGYFARVGEWIRDNFMNE